MIFERFKTPGIASVSYLVGDSESGEAVVVDPGRDLEKILAAARTEGLTIRYIPDPARTGAAAGQLYDAVLDKLLPLGDQCLIFPAHGSGSVCGGQISDRDDSTIGLERLSNPVFTLSRDDFVASKVEERIPRPPYLTHI